MIKFSNSVVVQRPIDEVFAYLVNSEHDAEWEEGVVEVRKTSEGPWGLGTTFVYVTQFMGRRIEEPGKITECQPNERFSFSTGSGGVRVDGTFTFEPSDGGTKVTYSGEAELGGLFKIARPLLAGQIKRQTETNMAKLKTVLEAKL